MQTLNTHRPENRISAEQLRTPPADEEEEDGCELLQTGDISEADRLCCTDAKHKLISQHNQLQTSNYPGVVVVVVVGS